MFHRSGTNKSNCKETYDSCKKTRLSVGSWSGKKQVRKHETVHFRFYWSCLQMGESKLSCMFSVLHSLRYSIKYQVLKLTCKETLSFYKFTFIFQIEVLMVSVSHLKIVFCMNRLIIMYLLKYKFDLSFQNFILKKGC